MYFNNRFLRKPIELIDIQKMHKLTMFFFFLIKQYDYYSHVNKTLTIVESYLTQIERSNSRPLYTILKHAILMYISTRDIAKKKGQAAV